MRVGSSSDGSPTFLARYLAGLRQSGYPDRSGQPLLGGEVIRPFAIAMLIGVIVGTYSSIYIAAPTLLMLENRFGKAGGSNS